MITAFHPTSTCAMGARRRAVRPRAARPGRRRPGVVDASVMPGVPRGNTNAPTIAIAERAADLVRGVVPSGAEALVAERYAAGGAP